jgi:hypothetical protein
MPYEPPHLSVLRFDFDAPPDRRPLGEPVLSARDVLAILYSAFAEIDEDDEHLSALKLEVLTAVGDGRVGLAVQRAIIGAAKTRDC